MKVFHLLCILPICISAAVSELDDAASYSAGKKSAEDIDRYFSEHLPERNYNLWLGKADRIYLHGAWKFRLIANSARNKKGVRRNLGISREGVESDYGEQRGFFKPEYDDSRWLNQPVPFSWSERFLKGGYVKNGSPYLPVNKFMIHEGWYRRSFILPEKWKTGRTLLHFRGVASKAKVYVNGELVCTHENTVPGHYWVGAGNTEDRFFCDITPYLKSRENLLAVKVFSSARNGGIWQTVYLERKENLYTEKILPSFDHRTGKLKLRVFFMNTGKAVKDPKLEFEFKPWNSFRYQRQWEEQKFSISAKTIPEGESEQTFAITLKDPKLWSPADPNLYHLIVKDSSGRIIGQERIGLRTFELGKNCFLLNGKRIFPMGENDDIFSWTFPGVTLINRDFGVLNKDRMMEKMWERYMGCGNTIFRGNGVLPLDIMMDFADEMGLLMTFDGNFFMKNDRVTPNDAVLENGKAVMSKRYCQMIRQRCFTIGTHPCVVMHTIANEAFEKRLFGSKWENLGWTPILDACYDEYKKWLPEMPIGSSSGRGWKKGPDIYHKNIGIAKADYDVCHPYGVNRSLKNAENDSYQQSYLKFKEAYALDHGSADRPMFVGESAEFYTFQPYAPMGYRITNFRKKDFKIKDGEFDRKWLAKNLRTVNRKYLSEACEYSLIPLVDSVKPREAFRIQGWHNRQVMEQFRRLRHIIAGYTLHCPAIFKIGTYGEYIPATWNAAKLAQQPVLACFSGFAPRNLFSGGIFTAELYLINDTENTLKNAEVRITLKDDNLLHSVNFADLQPGELAKLPVEFNVTAPDGANVMYLTVFEDGKQVGRNEFEIFVQDPSKWVLSGKRTPVVLMGRNEKLEHFLTQLKIPFSFTEKVPDNCDPVLIALPGISVEQLTKIAKWVENGGKAVVLEQTDFCDEMRLHSIHSGFRDWTEIVLRKHPVFQGLHQDLFRYWNGKEGDAESMMLFKKAMIPLTPGVLAMSMTFNYRMGMTIAEFCSGKGRWFVSQLNALDRLDRDSAAARYMYNLLNYATGGFDDPNAPGVNHKIRQSTFKEDPARIACFDLKPFVNMGFRDETANDGKGGWSDHGPAHDGRMFPTGKRLFAGIPFDVIDPEKNDGRSCIVLQGNKRIGASKLPKTVHIKMNLHAKKLFFLVTSKYTPKDREFASFRINMNIGKDGGSISKNDVKLVGFRNVGDWWSVKDIPEGYIGWKTLDPSGNVEVGAYVFEWVNPEPQVEIESVDFTSSGTGIPILIGISYLK